MKNGVNKAGAGGGARGEGKQEMKERYQAQSVIRAGTKVRELVLANDLRYNWTLTYKAEVESRKQAADDFKNFVKRLNYKVKQKIPYVAVMEIQKKRAKKYGVEVIHFHIAINQKLPITLVESAWGHGFVYVTFYSGEVFSVASYLAKYLKKDADQVRDQEQKRYFCSKGLKRPEKVAVMLSDEEFENIKSNAYNLVEYDEGIWLQVKEESLTGGHPGVMNYFKAPEERTWRAFKA